MKFDAWYKLLLEKEERTKAPPFELSNCVCALTFSNVMERNKTIAATWHSSTRRGISRFVPRVEIFDRLM